ncbi:MAG: phosphomethylpyrimidine synthase ThiC, partial [Ignisphaera sp.]
LSLPNTEQVKEGLIAAKIAAHAGDLIKLGGRVARRDIDISLARARLDWDTQIALSIDRERAKNIRKQFGNAIKSCSMCGQYCVFLLLEKYLANRGSTTSNLDEILARIITG